MAGRFEGRVVVITGTGGGQGRAAALAFAAEGARVVGCDVKEEGSAETVALVRAAGGEMVAQAPVDLGDPTAAAAWVEFAARAYGRIDVLYNNASATRFGSLEQLSVEDWQFTMRNEVDLVFYVTRAAWPHLSVRGGVVINTASVAGHHSAASGIAHTTSKAAVLAMTRCIADTGGPVGIRAFSLSPGPVETPGTKEMFAAPGVTEAVLAPLLIKRLGQPEDVVRAALFLASDEASWITGADLLVDGGMINA
jgi:NAD(P)-dependent dehydrogenase (short-subunit alcohol dehydrogenase family)